MTVCIGRASRRSGAPGIPGARSTIGPSWIGHVKVRPAPALAPYVDYYWVTRWDPHGSLSPTGTALLEPCVHLQVRRGRAEVIGVVRGTYRMPIGGSGCVIGVRFRPGGFYPFVRQPVAAFTDRTVPAEQIFRPPTARAAGWARALCRDVDTCGGDAAGHAAVVAAHLDGYLVSLSPERDGRAEQIANLVAGLADTANRRRVSDLARAMNCSERTLYRLFLCYVGVSPAWTLRHYRLQLAAARLTARPGIDVSGLAHELRYADQAHLIRDFRDTIGVTPGVYAKSLR